MFVCDLSCTHVRVCSLCVQDNANLCTHVHVVCSVCSPRVQEQDNLDEAGGGVHQIHIRPDQVGVAMSLYNVHLSSYMCVNTLWLHALVIFGCMH